MQSGRGGSRLRRQGWEETNSAIDIGTFAWYKRHDGGGVK